MKNNEWQFFDDLQIEDIEYVEQKKAKKQAKRKWREIENYKENKRLNSDIEELCNYNF